MKAIKKTGYTAEQIKKAEQIAQLLQDESKEKQKIIAMMGNAFVSGLEVGMQFPIKQETRV